MRVRVLGGALAILAVMLVSSVAIAQYPGQSVGQGSSDIWVMNLDNTNDANVVAAYIDQGGDPDSTVGATIDPLGNTRFPASSSGLGNDWLGSMVLYSDKELASVAELVWKNVPVGDGWSGSAYSGYSEGANDIFFPYIMKSKQQKSIVTIQCVDTVDCDVSMVYRDRTGVEATGNPFLDTIEPDSQESYDLFDASLNPNIPDVPLEWFGSLRVTSTQDIAGVAVMHYRQGYAADYNHFVPEGDTESYFPFVVRRNFGGQWRKSSDWSALVVQNMVGYPIEVYVSFYDRAGGAPLLAFTDTIPALSSTGYNTRYGTNGSNPELYAPLGEQFLGSAIVTSTDPIVGVNTLVRYPEGGLAGGTQGLPAGSSKLIYPNLYRTKNGNLWTGYSGVIVQNVDPDNSADVHVEFRNPNGSIGLQFDDTIPANSSHAYNTRYGAETPGGEAAYNALSTSWAGTAIITTDSPAGVIGIVHNSVVGSTYMYLTTYNPAAQ